MFYLFNARFLRLRRSATFTHIQALISTHREIDSSFVIVGLSLMHLIDIKILT
jgi:hypothetical protein